jgi:protease I
MATIAVMITNMFEDSEYLEPAKAFLDAGHKIIHIGFKAGEIVKGLKRGTEVTLDQEVKGLSIAGFDALLIPGGYSPDGLRIDPEAVRFTRDFVESGKPVFVICHGPQLLISARVLKGRKITGWKSVKEDILNAGAEFIDQEVVCDGNIISSRSPADLPAFIKASLKRLSIK